MGIYKNRPIEIGARVKVYVNLHKGVFSVVDTRTQLVIGHFSTVMLRNAHFRVGEKQRQRVIEQKRRGVHAYVVGELVAVNVERPGMFSEMVSYNPYRSGYFTLVQTQEPIFEADTVCCEDRKVFVLPNTGMKKE